MNKGSASLAHLALAGFLLCFCTPGSLEAQDSDWSTYLGDPGRRHYSELDQINRDNVDELEVAWVYDSGEARGGGSTMYTSPLIVDGVLYGLSPRLVAFALNAATGEELWRHDPGGSGAAQRGLMWWQDEDRARLFYTAGRELIALDASTGEPVEEFGENGRLDLTPSRQSGPFSITVPGIIFEDLIVLGFSTGEGDRSHAGVIRAYSAINGDLVWRFNSLPLVGGLGSETWADGALDTAGGANNWTGMALDVERELLFVPTGSATPDFYGASRLGDNLFANCLLALDARTGELRWYFQALRHDLWDRDFPSPPTLVQLERDGAVIDAVAVTTKSGHLFVFDRDTGESLYEIEEVETLPSNLPGEVASRSQPVSTVAFTRQTFEITTRNQDAVDFVNDVIKDLDQRPWAPPTLAGTLIYPAYDGGAEWGGSAFDPNSNRLILNAQEIGGIVRLYEIPVGFSNRNVYAENCGACHGIDRQGTDVGPSLVDIGDRLSRGQIVRVMREGRGLMPGFEHLNEIERTAALNHILSPESVAEDPPSTEVDYAFAGYLRVRDHEGLPGNTPPWGTLNSIDLATGEIDWQVPFGDYPDQEGSGYGAESYGGPVVTATGLIFIGATPDRKIRAYDVSDGKMLWQADLPAAGFATPAMYSVDGQQYVVIAAGGGRMGPPSGTEYIAFSLPN